MLKDQKDNFYEKPESKLINPLLSEIAHGSNRKHPK